jgi:histidinol-phosphate aminotransferase
VSGGARFVRPSLDQIPASEPSPRLPPGTVSLGLNEGPEGPFPSALEAMTSALATLNRYPGRGSAELTDALAQRLGVDPAQVFVAAGADAVIGYVCQATLSPGDAAVVPWPSFPSFVRDTQKRDAVAVIVPLADGAIDLDAVREAVTPRTRLVFLATPNNPTGLVLERDALVEAVTRLPPEVLPVIDEAYIDYLEPDGRTDAVADLLLAGRDVLAIRTFSKLYGLAGLRVGYGVGPPEVVAAMRKVQRGYDVGALAQAAALASLDDEAEVARRRAANVEAVAALVALLRSRGLEPLAGSRTNFVLVDVGQDADAAAAALLAHGVAVQSGVPFGAPTSLRVGAGTPSELDALAAALDAAALAR